MERVLTFLSELRNQGLDQRFSLDIASVKKGIRPRGLLHVHASLSTGVKSLLTTYGLKVIAERCLEGSRDPQSREGILSDLKADTKAEHVWHEIWFSSHEAPSIDSTELFRAPGRYLSYPKCCIKAMLATTTLSSFYDVYINDSRQRAWEINRLTTVFSDDLLIPDFFPCSLACHEARDFARPFIELAREVLGASRAAGWIERAKQPYFVYRDSLYTTRDYSLENSHLVVAMESMSKRLLKDIGRTISLQEVHFSLIPFAHFYNSPEEPLRITLTKGEQSLVELVASPKATA